VTCLQPSRHLTGRHRSSEGSLLLDGSPELQLSKDFYDMSSTSEKVGEVIGKDSGASNVINPGVVEGPSEAKGSPRKSPTEGEITLPQESSGAQGEEEFGKQSSALPEGSAVASGDKAGEDQLGLLEDASMEVVSGDLSFSKTEDLGGVGEEVDEEELAENHSQLKSAIALKKVIDRGALNLQYSMNVASLLGPVPLVPCDQTTGTSTESTLNQSCLTGPQGYLACTSFPPPSERTVDSYLKLCRQYLLFTSGDCEYASKVYQWIDQAGETGLSLQQLRLKVKGWNGEGQQKVDTVGCIEENVPCRDGLLDRTSDMDQEDQAELRSSTCADLCTGCRLVESERSGCHGGHRESNSSGDMVAVWNLEDIVASLTNFEMVSGKVLLTSCGSKCSIVARCIGWEL